MLRITRRDLDVSGEFDLLVPAFGRTFSVSIQLVDGASEITDKTVQTVNEIAALPQESRERIRELLYADAQRTAVDVVFQDLTPPAELPPSGFFRRLFWRPDKYRFVPLSQDDPRHPCYFKNGIEDLEEKIEWLAFRINENEQVLGRFALLDCRPLWEDEHGVTVVIRNGIPIEIDDYSADLRKYDDV